MFGTAVSEDGLRNWMLHRIAQKLNVTVDRIDVHVPLMTLGLDSLSLVELAGQLAELLERDVPADMLWEHDSIALLARHFSLNGDGAAESPFVDLPQVVDVPRNDYLSAACQWSAVRPLQAGGTRPPFFLAQGIAGGISEYYSLAAALGDDQPTFGLQSPPDRGDSIEKIAGTLLDGLRSVQRKGPYRLGGFCFGGILAFEIARRLTESGERVELLAMFDVPFPGGSRRFASRDLRWSWQRWTASCVEAPIYLMRELIEHRREFVGRVQRQISRLSHRVKRRIGMTQTSNADRFTELFFPNSERARIHVAATKAYCPGPPYSGPLLYFQSREFKALHGRDALGWKTMTTGNYEEILVPGRHQDLIESSAAATARHLQARMRL